MAKATANIHIHKDTGRLVLTLFLNGSEYGDYPLDGDRAPGQLNMAMVDADDYGCKTIEIEVKPFL